MPNASARSERGQALFLILITLLLILGFAALAVDVGNIFNQRRRAQSAADSAAMAAVSVISQQNPHWRAAALKAANDNGFNNDGETNQVDLYHPPISGPYSGDSEYFQVVIHLTTAPIFAQFVFSGSQDQSVEATAHYRPAADPSKGNALLALVNTGNSQEDGFIFQSDAMVNIQKGNVFSNGSFRKTGSDGSFTVTEGKIGLIGNFFCANCFEGANVSPQPNDLGSPTARIDPPEIPMPYCPEPGHPKEAWDGVQYYYHDAAQLGAHVEFEKGVHCIAGTINLSGADSGIWGQDVLLVFLDGGIQVDPGQPATIQILAPSYLKDRNGYRYDHLAIYSPKANTSLLTFGGSSNSWLNGTVFAPSAPCRLRGGGNRYTTALICDHFLIDALMPEKNLTIEYTPGELFMIPPAMELVQ